MKGFRMAKKILVIEDNPDMVKLLELRLTSQGYEVVKAFGGIEGLRKAESEEPDLITLDIELPEMNGFSVCSLLKANDRFRSIPVIMLTGRKEQADRIFDEDYKPDAYITKPFNAEELLGKIKELLKE